MKRLNKKEREDILKSAGIPISEWWKFENMRITDGGEIIAEIEERYLSMSSTAKKLLNL